MKIENILFSKPPVTIIQFITIVLLIYGIITLQVLHFLAIDSIVPNLIFSFFLALLLFLPYSFLVIGMMILAFILLSFSFYYIDVILMFLSFHFAFFMGNIFRGPVLVKGLIQSFLGTILFYLFFSPIFLNEHKILFLLEALYNALWVLIFTFVINMTVFYSFTHGERS